MLATFVTDEEVEVYGLEEGEASLGGLVAHDEDGVEGQRPLVLPHILRLVHYQHLSQPNLDEPMCG